jgi:hypothetical protein
MGETHFDARAISEFGPDPVFTGATVITSIPTLVLNGGRAREGTAAAVSDAVQVLSTRLNEGGRPVERALTAVDDGGGVRGEL